MRMYVFRHGETEFNRQGKIQGHTDIPLSELGMRQAGETAGCLRSILDGNEVLAVYSSDLERSRQTAGPFIEAICREGRHVPVEYRADLREINLGVWEGKTRKQLLADVEEDGISLFQKWLDNPREVVPENAESMPEFFERVKRFLFEVIEKYGSCSGYVVVFTHGGVVSMVQNYVHDRSPDDFIKYAVGNASGIVLDYRDNRLEEVGSVMCPVEVGAEAGQKL